MNVRQYYDNRASGYDLDKTGGFLSRFVKHEKAILMSFLDVKTGDTILDVGCGSGFYSRLIRERGGEPFGVDISQGMISAYRTEGFDGAVLDIAEAPVRRIFNKVFCGGSLEFTSSPERSLKHMSESLEKGSLFVLLYPRLNAGGLMYKLYHLTHGIRIHLFSDRKIAGLLKNSDLEILKLEKPTFFAGVVLARKSR